LEGIRNYLEEHHPSFTKSTIRRLYDAARSLKEFSHRGRVGQKEGTRELLILPLPYVIVYRADSNIVHILRVIHTAEDWR
jgi:toxin ParE1/3/4